MKDEFSLIDELKNLLGPSGRRDLLRGIGEDTSVRKLSTKRFELLTHDLLLEGVHFIAGSLHDFENLGWKALAVNLSDIAAMGGAPVEAVVGLGLPRNFKVAQVKALYRGLKSAAKKFHCPIVGGDTNRSKDGWVIAVTVVGETDRFPLCRSGAKPGDTLWVSGEIGSAALGWQSIRRRSRAKIDAHARRRHARPTPRLIWGSMLLQSGLVSAMIDISDGVAGDVLHLSKESKVGFCIALESLPRLRGFSRLCARLKLKEIPLLLSGGEDYELLFTVRQSKEEAARAYFKKHGIKAACIGQAQSSLKIDYFLNGKLFVPVGKGFRHF